MGFIAALVLQVASVASTGGSATGERLASGARAARAAGALLRGSGAAVVVTGLALLAARHFAAPWAWIALLCVAGAGALGGAPTALWRRSAAEAARGPSGGPLPAGRLASARGPLLAVTAACGLAAAVIFLMTVQPQAALGSAAALAGGAAGLGVGWALAR